jgi:hypothetical protein
VGQPLGPLQCEIWLISYWLRVVTSYQPLLVRIGHQPSLTAAPRFSRRYDYQRALNEDPKSLRQWFATVQRTIDEKGIQPEDIYYFDETGFAMGLISAQKVVTRAEYYGRRSILQPGNREWVTAIESICADGYSLPPCIVFQAKVYISA